MGNLRLELAEQSFALSLLLCSLPLILVLSLFHGCDVRHRSEKADCRAGRVEACLAVAQAYEGVTPDDFGYLFSMIFGYHHAAKTWNGEACKLGSAPACYRFGLLSRSDGDDWFGDTSVSTADQLTGLSRACAASVPKACHALGEVFVSDADAPLARQAYGDACDAGASEACALLPAPVGRTRP